MKLTKSRLKQIIKEELEKVLPARRSALKEQDEVEYTKKEVRLGTTRGGRPRMGFQYTASFKGVSAAGTKERDMIKARASAYRALLIKMATQKKNQASAVKTTKLAPMPIGGKPVDSMLAKSPGMSVDPSGMPTRAGASTDLMQPYMPEEEPENFPAKAAPMPQAKPEKFMGLGTTSILKQLFPNDRPGPAFKKLMKLPKTHPARKAFRVAYKKKDRS
tara:strand:+ start:1421 stop:2074 length:654 start_codon:yes stop_codon:yes gene_type:complete